MLMSMNRNRARFAVLACIAATAVAAGCDRVKHELLEPQNPGLVDPSAVGSPTAALALRVGALGRYKQVQAGESIWQYGGTLADEFKNADFEAGRINADMRLTDVAVTWNYNGVTQARGFVRDAIAAMKKYNADSTALIGELYMELAFFEMTLADNYCNGIPLGHTENGQRTNGSPLPIAQVYDSASNHLDTALALSSKATDAGSVYINRAARVWKARVMIAKDKANAATAAALLATVPTTFVYDMTFSSVSGSNGMWSLVNSTARISVSDSFDILNGVPNTIKNALPFASSKDPRVPVVNGDSASPKVVAEDQVTRPFYVALLFKGQFDPLVLASGVDARLYEAEAKLQANDIPGMMTILNALRTDSPRPVVGVTTIPVMATLSTPASQADAITLLFREKAFWTFGRGQRLPDLRRLVRQYGRTDDQVFPTGNYFKGGKYGTDENFPVPASEQVNPLFSACLDRKA
jgi:starch-binding outer membrane protein, SusD/RagB family